MSNLVELKNNLISCYDKMRRSSVQGEVVTCNDIADILDILFQTIENLEARISDLQICECGEKYEYEDAKCKQCYKPICGNCSIVDMCNSCSYPYAVSNSDRDMKICFCTNCKCRLPDTRHPFQVPLKDSL